MKSFSPLHVFYLVGLATTGCGARSGGVPAGMPAVEAPPKVAATTPLRRLTRDQYRNSVRDLLGVTDVPIDLAIDEGIAGFFGNTTAPVSELHLEKYGRTADLVARKAVLRLDRLLPCDPAIDEAACSERFIAAFGRRAFRRPLDAEELQLYRGLFAAGRGQTGGNFANGVRLVLSAMLQSPSFLYLVEPRRAAGSGAPEKVPPYALAARLSFFLWNTTPDEVLLNAAETNQLATRAQVEAQVRRMMTDPRFGDGLTSFHLQWLDLMELDGVEKRGRVYPLFSHGLRAQMREETVRFVDHVIRHADGRFPTLLGARFSFVGGKLPVLYGLTAPEKPVEKVAQAKVEAKPDDKADEQAAEAKLDAQKDNEARTGKKDTRDQGPVTWQRVDLKGVARAGVLTQASVMTMHAHWDKPSLVLRGRMLREKLFCTVLPPPPPEVNNTLPQADPKMSIRERFEDHRADVGCSKCHRLIDPLGIPFENYDGIGAWRTTDGPAPVDPTSDLSGTKKMDGPVKNALELIDKLAATEEVHDCLALQWFRFGLGRDEAPEDEASLAAIRRTFRDSGLSIPALVAAVATSDAFRYQSDLPAAEGTR